MHCGRSLLSLLAVATPLLAQPAPHTPTSPAVFGGYFAPGSNLLPHARTGGLIQVWQRGDSFTAPQVILAVGVRPNGAIAASTTQSMEIVMDNATVGFSGLVNTFASNLSGTQSIVFARRTINLPPVSPASAQTPILWMPLDVPWAFTGPNYLIQFDMGTAVGALSGSHQADAYSMSAVNSTLHTQSSPSCGGTLVSGYDTTTGSYTLSLSGAVPSGFVLHMLSANNRRFAGVVPLPLMLDSLGLTGCYLGLDPLIYVASVASASGTDVQSIPFPVPTTDTTVLYAQSLHAAGNALGLATSNLANGILGGAGLSTYLYNFTADGPTAQFGPYTTNRGPVLLFQ